MNDEHIDEEVFNRRIEDWVEEYHEPSAYLSVTETDVEKMVKDVRDRAEEEGYSREQIEAQIPDLMKIVGAKMASLNRTRMNDVMSKD